jgi:predicted enzyme related to lactoylglutathione lyase
LGWALFSSTPREPFVARESGKAPTKIRAQAFNENAHERDAPEKDTPKQDKPKQDKQVQDINISPNDEEHIMSTPKGKFVWYEYMVDDVDAGLATYADLVGWGSFPFGELEPGKPPYQMLTVGDQPVAGIMKLPDEAKAMGAPPHFMGYVSTPDIAASVAQAVELGATVYVPVTPVPEVGQFAVLADPQGAAQSLFQPNTEDPPGLSPDTPGTFCWRELMTSDLDGAWAYYSALHGWEKTDAMDMGEMGTYQMYGRDGETYGGMMLKPPGMETPAAWLYYLTVTDLDATIEKIKSGGGQLLNGPMEVPGGGRVAQVLDPQGAAVAFFSGPARG